jgi:hypothetical protein
MMEAQRAYEERDLEMKKGKSEKDDKARWKQKEYYK